jgi:hypothetical protein
MRQSGGRAPAELDREEPGDTGYCISSAQNSAKASM